MDTPKTLIEAINFFSNAENCRMFMIATRWEDGVVKCPTCGSSNVLYMAKSNLYNCRTKHSKQKFSLKVGTIFEDSPISLEKWLPASWLLSNCKNGISSYELARAVGVTQKSAWFMLHRIREAMMESGDLKIGHNGPVEIDETFVGGKVKNMHRNKRPKGGVFGGNGKAIVLGMLERGGKVRANTIADRSKRIMKPSIDANVVAGGHIITDEHASYPFIAKDAYYHEVINHIEGYVRNHVHTNGIENFWSCLKRGLNGTYISVEPIHLDKYVDEQVFRFNNRKDMTDMGRLTKVVSQTVGRRLTYNELTGKQPERAF